MKNLILIFLIFTVVGCSSKITNTPLNNNEWKPINETSIINIVSDNIKKVK